MANIAFDTGSPKMTVKTSKADKQIEIIFTPASTSTPARHQPLTRQWTRGVCPNCGFSKADVDPDGVLWCPACGYSQKGCYT